ncbi:ribonuclease R [Mycoplasmopsis meleagridis]|uniref:ribonuclease R n=1 Tax=Mycoplasmopsis meleagridis TaxID=29561 RepID=UPI003A890817
MVKELEIYKILIKYAPIDYLTLARKANIKKHQNSELTSILKKLKNNNKITENKDHTYSPVSLVESVEGKIEYASEGKFAFVNVEENSEKNKSIFIPKNEFNGAFNGDIVKVNVLRYLNGDSKDFGKVTEILESKIKTISGIIKFKNNCFFFEPINKNFKDFFFTIIDSSIVLENEIVVSAEILKKSRNNFCEISIINKIGDLNDPMVFVNSYLVDNNVSSNFSNKVLAEALKLPNEIDKSGIINRLDLRNETIVTIDGNDTKDFDDAISVKINSDNTYELGVHIADVSYYVKENSEIDKEALKRGTSIYLVNKVIPMLPEKLSNGICSLNPNVDRFTLSTIMTIDKSGNTLKCEIKPTIIRSKYRLTYDRVNQFINENKLFDDNKLNEMLDKAVELAKIIRKYKNDQGYIDFEIKEPYVKTNDKGEVLDIIVKETGFAENLIEDFMVRANEEVALYLAKHKFPAMYRIHEKPSEEKLIMFKEILNELNINVEIDMNNITPKSFRETIEKIKLQRDDEYTKMLFLRTMSKAIYSSNNIGHFGLASNNYCHFTSPIRRYPDLIIHRIIRDLVLNKNKSKVSYYNQILENIAKQNTESEALALLTERSTNDLKFAEYWKSKIGEKVTGQVLSIMPFGLFVQFENHTEAMVHKTNMCDNEYEINDLKTEFKSQNRVIKIGDNVDVIISGADEKTGKVDAILYECFISQNFDKKGLNDKK